MTSDTPTPETVFAPEVPQRDRKILLKEPKEMIPAAGPIPKAVSNFRAAPGAALGGIVFVAVVDAVVVALAARFLPRILPALAAEVAFGLVAGIGILVIVGLIWGATLTSLESDLARKHHGKYLQASDWDADAQQLMLRAQAAVRAVTAAEVTRRGLLDDIQNDVVLPEQLWDIGQILQKLTVLRSRHREIDAAAASVLSETVTRQADALQRTEAAMERKVATLEKYADQVRSADALLRAERAVEQVRKDDDAYVELLASAEPAAGTALIEDLSEDAIDLHQQLALRLAAIRETSQALTPSPEA
ncbi:hypothetical protein ACFCV3_20265 [Kribbella sp. NPDC056345]|uniref:hypothetical protein n=1 Tax=Kribbella sp. NPDC056345 TaxID=3345789 RepID=UPI0035D9FFDF